MNETQTKENEWKDAPTPNLATYASCRVGDVITGQLTGFEMKEETTGKKKKGTKEEEMEFRPYFTFQLTEGTTLKINKKENRDFKPGDSVKVQGKGNLQYLIERIAAEKEGKDVKVDTKVRGDVLCLIGAFFHIQRSEDGEMNKGAFEGNPVQRYEVKWMERETQ